MTILEESKGLRQNFVFFFSCATTFTDDGEIETKCRGGGNLLTPIGNRGMHLTLCVSRHSSVTLFLSTTPVLRTWAI